MSSKIDKILLWVIYGLFTLDYFIISHGVEEETKTCCFWAVIFLFKITEKLTVPNNE